MSVSNACAVAEGWRDRKVCDREDDDTWWAMILIDTRDTDTTLRARGRLITLGFQSTLIPNTL